MRTEQTEERLRCGELMEAGRWDRCGRSGYKRGREGRGSDVGGGVRESRYGRCGGRDEKYLAAQVWTSGEG